MKTDILKVTSYGLGLLMLPMCQSKISKVIKEDINVKMHGVWGPSKTENASFRIDVDSIYYPDNFKSYKFEVHKDSIFIHYAGWTYKGIIYFSNDSLVLAQKNKKARYVKIAE